MPSVRTTYMLAAFAVLALAYLVFFDSHFVSTAEAERHSGRVLHLVAADIEKVKLWRDAWTSALIERAGTHEFRLVEPAERVLDSGRIYQLLSELEFLQSKSELRGDGVNPEHLYAYGLSQPRLTVALTLADGSERHIVFGADAPVGNGVYVRVSDEKDVHVVDNKVLALFDRALDQVTETDKQPAHTDEGN